MKTNSDKNLEVRTTCRACESNNFFEGLNFGMMPIANELMSTRQIHYEEFPLEFTVCSDCGLGQILHDINPERLFSDYRYTSSTSATTLQHSQTFAERMQKELLLDCEGYVLEIACNDGYLLKSFAELGLKCIGVDPAINLATQIVDSHIEIEIGFFGSQLASELLEKHGYPKLIIANNVLAHVPDINDFMLGLKVLCNQETVITIENPSLLNLSQNLQIDTIYHEHFSYISAHSVQYLTKKHQLKLLLVEPIPTHGGSNRYYIGHVDSRRFRSNASSVLNEELNIGLFNPQYWHNFSTRAQTALDNTRDWFLDRDHLSIFGFGAAAKASTILNGAKITSAKITAIGDNSPEKIGKFMPRERIPIISIEELVNLEPRIIVIFPWNIKREIILFLQRNKLQASEFWQLVPQPERIS